MLDEGYGGGITRSWNVGGEERAMEGEKGV